MLVEVPYLHDMFAKLAPTQLPRYIEEAPTRHPHSSCPTSKKLLPAIHPAHA